MHNQIKNELGLDRRNNTLINLSINSNLKIKYII